MSNPVTPLTAAQVAAQESRGKHESYPVRVLVALDKAIAVAAGGTPDVTISADAGVAAYRDKGFKGFYGRTMSGFLGLFQKNHGAAATAGDVGEAEEAYAFAQSSGLLGSIPSLPALEGFIGFMSENYGVLVTDNAAGHFCCQSCGAQGAFANLIVHAATCVFKPFEKG